MKRLRFANVSRGSQYVLITLILALTALVMVWMFRPHPREGVVPCSDGPHPLIDATQFQVQYWTYSLKLQGSLDKVKLVGDLVPSQLQQLSEALQQGNELRKWLVNSYNACAISQHDYALYGQTFARMDSIARSIDRMRENGTTDQGSQGQLRNLVKEYVELSQELGATKK